MVVVVEIVKLDFGCHLRKSRVEESLIWLVFVIPYVPLYKLKIFLNLSNVNLSSFLTFKRLAFILIILFILAASWLKAWIWDLAVPLILCGLQMIFLTLFAFSPIIPIYKVYLNNFIINLIYLLLYVYLLIILFFTFLPWITIFRSIENWGIFRTGRVA